VCSAEDTAGVQAYDPFMRNLGGILLLLGIFGFFYATSKAEELAPVPEGLSIGESLQYPAGRWEIARYGIAAIAATGLLLLLFPKGR
jgi:hypothetical protein